MLRKLFSQRPYKDAADKRRVRPQALGRCMVRRVTVQEDETRRDGFRGYASRPGSPGWSPGRRVRRGSRETEHGGGDEHRGDLPIEEGEGLVKKCLFCGRFFTPDPRAGDRQKACHREKCRKARKQLAQSNWSKKHPAYFKDRHERAKERAGVRTRRKQKKAIISLEALRRMRQGGKEEKARKPPVPDNGWYGMRAGS